MPYFFQGHLSHSKVTRLTHWGFPKCNSSLSSQMSHRALWRIEEVPHCFQGRTSISKFTRDRKLPILTRIFPDRNSSLNSLMALKWCAWPDLLYSKCPLLFSRSFVKWLRASQKKLIWKHYTINGLKPSCFSRSSIKFQGDKVQKMIIWIQFEYD